MANVIIGLLILGLLGILKLRMRYEKIISWVIFFIFGILFFQYIRYNDEGLKDGFSILWGESQIGNITLDFFPTHITNNMIIPLFFTSFIAILNNNIFHGEENRSSINGFVILNFIALSLIICAQNYVQLITMVFFSDIIGYLVLRNVDLSKKYVSYNFFADMCLFMILALACGRIQSFDIKTLLGYEQIGKHKDFVGIMTATALFIKMGCFPFQQYLTDMSAARFQRIIIINLFTAPLVGVLLLLKLHNLLFISELTIPYFNIITITTFFAGLVGFIKQTNLQKKVINLNIMFMGLLLRIIYLNEFSWDKTLTVCYISMFFLNYLFFTLYLYQNKEKNITQMIKKETITQSVKALLLQIIFLCSCFFVLIWKLANIEGKTSVICQLIIMLVAIGIILNHIYKTKKDCQVEYCKLDKNRIFPIAINFLILLAVLYKTKENMYEILIIAYIMILTIISPLGNLFLKLYKTEDDTPKKISILMISTIKSLGKIINRFFWFLGDMFLSEKIITYVILRTENMGKIFLAKKEKHINEAGLLSISFIIAVFLIAFYYKGMQ